MKGKQKRQAVALFRYGVIAPVLHAAAGSQARYFGRMARKELDVPGLGRRRYSVATFKSWLRRYRQEGLDGLLPKRRCDAGRSRVISEQLSAHISELLARHPRVPVNRLREQLVASGHITSRRISESTLRSRPPPDPPTPALERARRSTGCLCRHIKRAGLRPQVKPAPKARKHFEKPHANDLWVMDFMHGPKVPLGRRRRKTYLAAAIDDHSRFLTLARFYTRENSAVVVSALQKAFSRHGLPQILYCDNGSAFSSKQLTLACARLGVALVHSKPYDSPSRGKIERWFRTLRQGFLSLLDLEALTLDDLNARLSQWLEQDYHRRRHSSICETPLERYLRSLASIRRRTVSRAELDRVFYRTLHRTVRNDCTVSIARRLWEVPPQYTGLRIEIRHPEGRPSELFLFEDDQPVVRLHRVDAAQNATSPRRPRFSLPDEEDES